MTKFNLNSRMDVAKFGLEIEDWISENASHLPVSVIQRKLAFDILKHAVMYTPVRTGYLRFNWQVGVNDIPDTPVGERPKTRVVNNKEVVVGKKLPPASTAIPKPQPYSIIYLSNPVEYAQYVEEGTAKVPASKMLARAIQNVRVETFGATS